jgi:hypothetical protein
MAGVVIRDMSADAEFATQLEQALLDDLSALMPQASNATPAYAAQTASGTCTAGTKRQHVLWLAKNRPVLGPSRPRAKGAGTQLLDTAMSAAKARGCHACLLETSYPDAREFYQRLGFLRLGKLGNLDRQVTPNHSRWFLHGRFGPLDAT